MVVLCHAFTYKVNYANDHKLLQYFPTLAIPAISGDGGPHAKLEGSPSIFIVYTS
jgi:hypothetical protein